jgi:CSLREA domain-containing protein
MVLALGVMLGLALPASADGANFVVTRLDDPVPGACVVGDCSLREAVIAANGSGAPDSITMGGGTHDLTQASASSDSPSVNDLDVIAPLTITGAGAATTTIDANGIDRVLDADVTAPGVVQLIALKITGGSQSGIENLGGTDLRLTDVAVVGNTGSIGGGIDSNSGGSLTLDRTTVSNNTGSSGGGIWVAVDATLTNSTIARNTATSEGGGFYNEFGTSTLINTTVAGNTAPASQGGGITNFDVTELKNTIVYNNTGGNCETFDPPTSLGHNLEDGSTCGLTGPGDRQNTNPMLGPLADNGGQTQTRALLPGSPAIDAGDNAGCPATDQRGVSRPQGVACDIGAYEFVPPDVTPPVTTIVSGPSGETTDTTPTFDFSSSEPGSSFDCRIDGGAFAPCSSPFTAPALPVGPHTFEVRAIDAAGNADPTPELIAFVVVLPPPILGTSFNVVPLSGVVYVSLPGGASLAGDATVAGAFAAYTSPVKGRRFVPLQDARQLPVGSFLDTRAGRVRITSASTTTGKTFSGAFASGVFQVLQSRRKKLKGLTTLRLKGSSFGRCRRARGSRPARAALSRRTIRRLRSNASGRYRTRGRYSAATVRGTKWTVADRCDGTLTTVSRGRVAVRDFRLRKTIVVRRGKRYLARP